MEKTILLDIFANIVAGIGVIMAVRLLFSRRKAEKELRTNFEKVVKNHHKTATILNIKNKINHGNQPNNEELEVYFKIMTEALAALDKNEQKIMNIAIKQSSKKGRLNFIGKFLGNLSIENQANN